jgi:DNA gyrase subunit A
VEEYRAQGRGGKGIINVRTTDKNGKVVAIMPVNEDSDVLVMTANGKLIRVRSTNIRAVGRATQGVRLIQLDDDDKVTAATLTESEGENGNGNGSETEAPPTIN